MSYVLPPGSSHFWSQGVSGFHPSFQFLGSKKQSRIGDRIFTINLVGQHSLILRTKPFVEAIPLHLLHMFLLDSARTLHLDYLYLLR